MNDLVVQGIVAAVVAGAVEGWRRASQLKAKAELDQAAGARTQRLGENLGPRVEALSDRVARLEGALGLTPQGNRPPGPPKAVAVGPEDPTPTRRR